jgi:eukaryotic-like serine/threonine-protein kinase
MPLAPGTHLGPYEILSPLGAGGMGEVYRARDTSLGRDVAVKILRAGSTHDSDRLRRFHQEAQSAASLNHPNILAIHFVGEQEGSPYIVSELLEGESLRERLRSGVLPVRKCIDYAAQIADGLAAAHEKGIVHRDLKPENVFLSKDGRAKILDFGLAKLTRPEEMAADGGSRTLTQGSAPGVVLGTVGYMSPEQVRGKTLDPRSDIFSFGLILYEMLSRKNVFLRGTTADTMSAILKEDPPELPQSPGGISPALDRVVRRCLEKEPADRFQSVRDLGFALQAVAGSGASSSSAVTAAISDTRKRSLRAGLLAAVALLAVVAAYFAGRHGTAGLGTAQPTFHRLTFRPGSIMSARFAPDGHAIIYGAKFDGGSSRIYTTNSESPESRTLEPVEGSLFGVSASGEMAVVLGCKHQAMLVDCRGTLARIPLAGGAPREVMNDVEAADWLADGSDLVVAQNVGGHRHIEFPIGNPVYESTGWISSLRVSPQGDRAAFIDHAQAGSDAGTVLIINRHGDKKVLTQPLNSLEGLAWSPSGKEIWFVTSPIGEGWANQLRSMDLSGRQTLLLQLEGTSRLHDVFRDGRVLLSREEWRDSLNFRGPGDQNERDLSWFDLSGLTDMAPDGSAIVFWEAGDAPRSASGADIYLRKTDGSPAIRLGEGGTGALSPDKKSVFVLTDTDPEQLVLMPVGVGEVKRIDSGGVGLHLGLGFHPDGKHIVFAGNDGHGWFIYIQDLDGGKPRRVSTEIDQPEFIDTQLVSPDGRFVWARDPQKKNWIYPLDGSQPRPVLGITADDLWANWGADGGHAYIYRNEFPIRVYRLELATGRRTLAREFMPANPIGLVGVGAVRMARNEKSGAYTYTRASSELYLVTGLK